MAKQPRMPNMQQMMQQVQKMQQDMEIAQEELKSEVVEASAGGGMVTVKVAGDLELRRSGSTPPLSIRRMSRSSPTWCSPPSTRRCGWPRSWPSARWAEPRPGSTSGRSAGWVCRGCERELLRAPVQRLVTELSKLPGIGSRTAQRLAFHILRAPAEDAAGLADAIREVKERIGLCEVCFNLTDETRCRICQDARRDRGLICVVEEPSDVIPMERTHEYHGVYHVLGGALSPIDGVDPEDLQDRRAAAPGSRRRGERRPCGKW